MGCGQRAERRSRSLSDMTLIPARWSSFSTRSMERRRRLVASGKRLSAMFDTIVDERTASASLRLMSSKPFEQSPVRTRPHRNVVRLSPRLRRPTSCSPHAATFSRLSRSVCSATYVLNRIYVPKHAWSWGESNPVLAVTAHVGSWCQIHKNAGQSTFSADVRIAL